MEQTIILLTLTCSATAHFIISCVMALYARHKTQYLCLAWVNGIFTATLATASFFSQAIAQGQPGILHPIMLLVLVTSCYLQSIYPLSIPMPGFLQWRRMWKYASPALLLIALYLLAMLFGSELVIINHLSEIPRQLISGDVLLRVAALGLSIYYTINIFRLPHQMARHSDVPRYLIGYCTALGISVVFYIVLTIFYSPVLLTTYLVFFSMLNLYLTFRTLEDIAIHMPRPVIVEVTEEPTAETAEQAEQQDFNEANQYRFQRIEYWMQQHKDEWKNNTFGRDRLCEAVGYNRHLLLQSVRSQGYNNVHEYINSHRIEELKKMIMSKKMTNIGEAVDAGFGTLKTARVCFEKSVGRSLDDYFNDHCSPRAQ